MQYRPPFVYLNGPNDGRTSFQVPRFPLPSQPQYHLTVSLWVPSYLVAAASYRAYINSAPDVAIDMTAVISCGPRDQGGGQSRPGGGVSLVEF